MENNKLPIADSPIIGRLHITYPLAIILNDPRSLEWYYSHYIQLTCNNKIESKYLDLCFDDTGCTWYTRCCWLETQIINPVSDIYKRYTIHELIRMSIDKGCYLITHADEFYIPDRIDYQIKHFRHVVLIYGYNNREKYYNIIGFNKNRVYKETKVSFDEFEAAYENKAKTEIIEQLSIRQNAQFEFDLKLVEEQINDYLYSNNSTKRNRIYHNPTITYAYGLDVYKYLEAYYEKLLKGYKWYDFSALHILWEHKKCMCRRIVYMQEHNYLSRSNTIYEDYVQIEKSMQQLKNMFIKYTIRKDDQIIIRIMTSLKEIAAEESIILKQLLDEIKI